MADEKSKKPNENPNKKGPNPAHEHKDKDALPTKTEQEHMKTGAKRPNPTKPVSSKNPVGVDHNPAQGGPSIRRNTEAGKQD